MATPRFEYIPPFLAITKEEMDFFTEVYYPKYKKVYKLGKAFCNFWGIPSFNELEFEKDNKKAQEIIDEYVKQYEIFKTTRQDPSRLGGKSRTSVATVGEGTEPANTRNLVKKRKKILV